MQRKLVLALATAGLIFTTAIGAQQGREYFDPVLEPGVFCAGNEGLQPRFGPKAGPGLASL